jgi:hypothetical protein
VVKIYLKNYKQFKKYLLLFIYLISGLFLRRTELVTLRFLNNNKNPREIFLDIRSNLFIINIYYYKGQGFSKKKTFNIRYLYSVVSCIFLLYIVLVDLFIEFLNINIFFKKKLKKLVI